MVMHRVLAIFAFGILCAPCFAQQSVRTAPYVTGAVLPSAQVFHEDVDVDLELYDKAHKTRVSYEIGASDGAGHELQQILTVNGKPVFAESSDGKYKFAHGWDVKHVDACRIEVIRNTLGPKLNPASTDMSKECR